MLFVPEGVSRDLAQRLAISQVDDWINTTTATVPVGAVVAVLLYLVYWDRRGDVLLNTGTASLLGAYAALFAFCLHWRHRMRHGGDVVRSLPGLLLMRFILGVAWSLALAGMMRLSDPVERAMVASLPSGLMSTALFGGPTLFALSFWVPTTIGGFACLYVSGVLFTAAPLACLGFYAALTLGVIITFDRKVYERNVATARLEQHAETISILLRDFEESASDWLWETDEALTLRHVSARFGELLGRAPATLEVGFLDLLRQLQKCPEELGLPPALRTLEGRIEARAPFREIVVPVTVSTEQRWWAITGKPLFDAKGDFLGYRGVGSDVTVEHKSRQELDYLARHDPLTSLVNRNEFTNALAAAVSTGGRGKTAVLCLDLDEFKAINDGHGHDVGDAVLRVVAQRLRGVLRADATVARLGGDEFAVLVPVQGAEEAGAVADRLIDTLTRPFSVRELLFRVGISIGIALAPDDGGDSETLYRNADLALYRAKAAGRGTWRLYNGEMDEDLFSRRLLARDLRDAMPNGELFVVYQPIFDLRTREIAGLEALVRWQHPTRGLVMPGEFIPTAEKSGLVSALGIFVLAEAADLAAQLPDGIGIAVNLSPVQLRDEALVAKVERVLAARDVSPSRIGFEITESMMIEPNSRPLDRLAELRSRGHQIALDDFGVAYSSLGVLRSFRFDRLKVDSSFVADLTSGGGGNPILETIIGLARLLGISVAAEGVENEHQASLLVDYGCTAAQGFYFSEPMNAAEVVAFVAARRAPPLCLPVPAA